MSSVSSLDISVDWVERLELNTLVLPTIFGCLFDGMITLHGVAADHCGKLAACGGQPSVRDRGYV